MGAILVGLGIAIACVGVGLMIALFSASIDHTDTRYTRSFYEIVFGKKDEVNKTR